MTFTARQQLSGGLAMQGWNRLRVELCTHSRNGLTENDFILAAKLNAVSMEDLLSKKKP